MDLQASYTEGHLLVAAIRILTHRAGGKPPTEDEIAQLLSNSREWTGVLVSALERAGAVRLLTGPFETRVEILDHLALEKLPKRESTSGVEDDLKEFAAKKRAEDEKLRGLFTGEALARKDKEKMGKLADQFKSYKPKPPKGAPFMKDSEDD